MDRVKFDLDYARQVVRAEAEAIKLVESVIDDSFAKAVDMIYNCSGSVIVSGIGKAGIIGQKISATLASTGTPSHFLHPAEAVHGDLGRVRKDDIVLVLSYGGETDEISRLINMVKQLEIKLLAVTGDSDSTLSKHSDVVLCMGKISEACPLGVAPSVSTACMLAIGDANRRFNHGYPSPVTTSHRASDWRCAAYRGLIDKVCRYTCHNAGVGPQLTRG